MFSFPLYFVHYCIQFFVCVYCLMFVCWLLFERNVIFYFISSCLSPYYLKFVLSLLIYRFVYKVLLRVEFQKRIKKLVSLFHSF